MLKVAKYGAYEGMDEYYRPIEGCKGFIFTTKKTNSVKKGVLIVEKKIAKYYN